MFSLLQCSDFIDFSSGCIVRNNTHFCNRKSRLRLLASTSVLFCSLSIHRRKMMPRLLSFFFPTAWILVLPSILSYKLSKFSYFSPQLSVDSCHTVQTTTRTLLSWMRTRSCPSFRTAFTPTLMLSPIFSALSLQILPRGRQWLPSAPASAATSPFPPVLSPTPPTSACTTPLVHWVFLPPDTLLSSWV